MHLYRLSNSSKTNREGIDPRLIKLSDLAIKMTIVDFGHGKTAGFRTAIQQNKLFKDNKSRADGYNKLSYHQSGRALDFYAYVDGKASWDKGHLAQVAAAFFQAASIKGYKIIWGGLWKSFQDYPHIQLVDD